MPKILTHEQVRPYAEEGATYPIRVLQPAEARRSGYNATIEGCTSTPILPGTSTDDTNAKDRAYFRCSPRRRGR